jgi:4-aminobutyrate aminotransferase/(S)-3-amino-2-methylpropionate transaminase
MARRYDLLLIVDEIMTGLGRTGRTFAVEHSGMVPDLLCVGKALANGFPISACVGLPDVMAAWPPSDGEAIHTSTFLGNPLGCAMALASLKEMKSKHLAAKAEILGKWWLDELQEQIGRHPRVAQIRGLGMMVGIEFVKDRKSLAPDPQWTSQVVESALKAGLVVLSGGSSRNILTLTPALTITKPQLVEATRLLKETLYGKS